jgi:DNA (cytosine-5)-methyltransferase 1
MNALSCLELFSGAGGLAMALGNCGVNHEALVEWNKDACNTLRCNFLDGIVHDIDIREFDFSQYGHVDIIAGGPPCQPFSLGGNHKGNLDDRDMFPYTCKAITLCTPKVFILENVKGLLRKSFSQYFEYILLRLSYPEVEIKKRESCDSHLKRLEQIHTSGKYDGVKYNIVFRLLDAADYGVPQRRERVVLVGIRDDLGVEWSFPDKTHSCEALLWSQFVVNDYWERHGVSPSDINCYDTRIRAAIEKLTIQQSLFPPDKKPWRTIRDQLSEIPEPDKMGSYHPEHVFKGGARSYLGHTGSFIDFPSKTIKAGGHGVPGGENMLKFPDDTVRYFTTYEAKRIQTFPSDYRITGSWSESMRQIGNAVPVDLGELIAKSVITSVWKDNI